MSSEDAPAPDFAQLAAEDHVSLATYRRSGVAVPTAVWFVLYDGALYARTLADAGKVKRVRNRADVTVAPCTGTGQVTGPALRGVARLVAESEESAQVVDRLLDEKYGEQRRQLARSRSADVEMLYIEVRPEVRPPVRPPGS